MYDMPKKTGGATRDKKKSGYEKHPKKVTVDAPHLKTFLQLLGLEFQHIQKSRVLQFLHMHTHCMKDKIMKEKLFSGECSGRDVIFCTSSFSGGGIPQKMW